MAASRTGSKRKSSGSGTRKKKSGRSAAARRKKTAVNQDLLFILLIAAVLFLFLCNFRILGPVGNFISAILFGLFGLPAYIIPLFALGMFIFVYLMQGDESCVPRGIAAGALLLSAGIISELAAGEMQKLGVYDLADLYTRCSQHRNGGGIFAGSLAYLLYHFLKTPGTILVLIVVFLICIPVLFEISLQKLITDRMIPSQEDYEEKLARKEENRLYRSEQREQMLEQQRIRQERRKQQRDEQQELRRRQQEEQRAYLEEKRRLEEEQRLYEEEQRAYEEQLRQQQLEEEENNRILGSEGIVVKGSYADPDYEGEVAEEEDEEFRERNDIHEIHIEDPYLQGPVFSSGDDFLTTLPEVDLSLLEENDSYDAPSYEPKPYEPEIHTPKISETERAADAPEIFMPGEEEEVYDAGPEAMTELHPKQHRYPESEYHPEPYQMTETQKPSEPERYSESGETSIPERYREPEETADSGQYSESEKTSESERNSESEDSSDSNFSAAFEKTIGPDIEKTDSSVRQIAPPTKEELKSIAVHREEKPEKAAETEKNKAPAHKPERREYVFPPIDLLKSGDRSKNRESENELRETAHRLQETLRTFGINVRITDISQGPTVTRYELSPEVGVKVSQIVSLQDDIRLSLAAADIRIEAPIPGKPAIGIEVPNKITSVVALRDILDTPQFREYKSKVGFSVGKDLGGEPIIGDIAKMPHMLIAGSTGSGKSVCINCIIMSILYKATPDEVKLIMIDPKIVELSVYNGIPHLLLPVVTEPKKASATLNWCVAEMEDRYRRFEAESVRDIKGYNAKIEQMMRDGTIGDQKKMPQMVIIVDELADLMMVAKNDVETSICRLAQLARAAGMHLIIATQRPSVNVITGLIKANMPSRVAFAVSSGVDSRTILDMVGAEKLLGKGDMLYMPQGMPKPARIQGAFVSDEEVTAAVNYIREHNTAEDPEDMNERLRQVGNAGGAPAGEESEASVPGGDEYFADAGKFIIEKNNASIGLLQRRFKIGFNRAARIMDELCEAGVVSESEGTKPRKVLMNLVEFENYLENEG